MAAWMAVCVLGACTRNHGEPPPRGNISGKLALPLLQGGTFDPESLAGKRVLLTFWSPDCGVCANELPRLQALADRRQDIKFVTVSVKDKRVKSGKIVRMTGLRAPVLVDRNSQLIKSFGGDRVPYTLVLNAQGKATSLFIGKQDPATFESALDRAGG